MSAIYEVRVAQVASFGEVPGAEIFWMSKFNEWHPLAALMGVIQGDGKTILINTGPSESFLPYMNDIWRKEFNEKVQMTVKTEQKTINVLSKFGIKPKEVDYVILTPLQAYTVGNVDLFPNAKICISRRGWIDFHAPRYFDPRRNMAIPDHILKYLVIDAWKEQRVHLLEDEETLLPGINIWFAGTHHRSSLGINIKTEKGTVIFSDSMFYYGNIENDHPIGIMENLEECKDTYNRIRNEANIIVPLYDPAVLNRYPNGCISKGKYKKVK